MLNIRKPLRRGLAIMQLTLYALASVVVPVAHAAATTSLPTASHWEAQSDETCRPAHLHGECTAFSVARLAAVSAGPEELRAPADVLVVPWPSAAGSDFESYRFTPFGPRPPPVV
jgi:hypothetical protein